MAVLDTVYAIDMDSCTLNTALVMKHLSDVLGQFGVEPEALQTEWKSLEQSDDPIEMWDHLRGSLIQQYNLDEQTVLSTFMAGNSLYEWLYPSVKHTFEILRGKMFIMTYGGHDWQMMKAKLAGIDSLVPITVVNTHLKGELIADAKQTDGLYHFQANKGELAARQVVLVDDKASAFAGLPNDCHGYQMVHGELRPKQVGELPKNATRIEHFTNFLKAEGVYIKP